MEEHERTCSDVVVRMHNAANVIERFFGAQDPWAVALRTDGDNQSRQVNELRADGMRLQQRARRHLLRILKFMTQVANDV